MCAQNKQYPMHSPDLPGKHTALCSAEIPSNAIFLVIKAPTVCAAVLAVWLNLRCNSLHLNLRDRIRSSESRLLGSSHHCDSAVSSRECSDSFFLFFSQNFPCWSSYSIHLSCFLCDSASKSPCVCVCVCVPVLQLGSYHCVGNAPLRVLPHKASNGAKHADRGLI